MGIVLEHIPKAIFYLLKRNYTPNKQPRLEHQGLNYTSRIGLVYLIHPTHIRNLRENCLQWLSPKPST